MLYQKNQQIEFIRAVSIIGVVAIHTVYSGILYSGGNAVSYVVLLFTMLKNLLYWAVPCFGIISGYLLLNPQKEISLKKIIGKYIARIVVVLLLFGGLFSWMEIVYNEHSVSIYQIPTALLMVLKHHSWEHLWYLYALITVYAALPLWRFVAKKTSNVMLCFIVFAVYVISLLLNSRDFSLHLFVLMGELFRRKVFCNEKRKELATFIGSSILILFMVYCYEVLKFDLNRFLGYTSFVVAIQSYALFSLLYKVDISSFAYKIKRAVFKVSENSFGIYIVHMFFVNLEYKFFHLNLMNSMWSVAKFLLLIVVNVVASYFVSSIMKKNTMLKKLL